MRLFKQYILFTMLLPSGAVMADEQVPSSFKATYKLYTSGMEIAETERSISKAGNDEYIYRSESRTIGLAALFRDDHIVEQSQWRVIDRQLYPLDYSYVRYRGEKDREVNIHFDWDNNLITSHINNKKTKNIPLESGVLDKLLYQYAIMRDLQNGQFPETYTIADGRKMQTYYFNRMGVEKINTPLGDLDTIKVQHIKPNDERKLVFWCAPGLKYLPVKIEHTEEDGRVTTAVLQVFTEI